MQLFTRLQSSRVLKISSFLIILIVFIVLLAVGLSYILNKKQLVAPSSPAWLYTNGTWDKVDEPGWGEVMRGKQYGTRATIETDSPFATITVFVDGKAALSQNIENNGKEHKIPIYSNRSGWHRIEVAFSSTSEINGLYISSKAKTRTPEEQKKKLVVIGHSYAEGCCLKDIGLKSFASLVGDILGVESINQGMGKTDIGVGGDYSALARVQSDVIQLKPDYVLSVYGFNAMGVTPHDQYQADYTKFVKAITDSLPETRVFASGMISLKGMSDEKMAPYNQDIKNACASVPRCTFIDLSGKWNDDNYNKYVSGDGIHPSEEGHKFLAEEYAKIISTVLKK